MSRLNDNFWKWFGNSITKRKDGTPMIFYHTTYNDFDVFEPISFDNKKAKIDYEKGRQQYYFTKYYKWAKEFADEEFTNKQKKKAKILEVYLKCEKPLIVLPIKKTLNQWLKWFELKGINISIEELYELCNGTPYISNKEYMNKRFNDNNSKDFFIKYVLDKNNNELKSFWQIIWYDTNKVKKILKKAGYDSVIIRDTQRGNANNLSVIVFNSNQIKSIDNNGKWSLSNNNINESK